MERSSSITWSGKVYRSYETERAGLRGNPSERYAGFHPFPTYRVFGVPTFVDQFHRQYRIGDGFDALEYEQTNSSMTNIFWEPNEEMSPQGEPGAKQFLYVRCPININKERSGVGKERLRIPKPDDSLLLTHLKTRITFQCKVESTLNLQNPKESCGSVTIYDIRELGIAGDEVARVIKEKLTKKYKKLIKVK